MFYAQRVAMEVIYPEAGHFLRELRQKGGLDITEAARLMNVSYSVLARAERGVSRPHLRYARRIAAYYGLTVSEIWDTPRPRKGSGLTITVECEWCGHRGEYPAEMVVKQTEYRGNVWACINVEACDARDAVREEAEETAA